MQKNGYIAKIERFQELINCSHRIVFFGGAGVSTESGIPDFRSKDGLYNQHDVRFDKFDPEYLLSHSCLYDNPKVFYEFYRQKMDCRGIEPNITHRKLAELEQAGKLSAIITQNIDGLHQKAGSVNVYEIHGTTRKAYCEQCHKKYDPDIIFSDPAPIPRCDCEYHGMIRPDVVLYEETLPKKAWNQSIQALQNADLLIIGGTSLAVYPANTLSQYYCGRELVIINRSETPQDKYATLVIHDTLGHVFERLKV